MTNGSRARARGEDGSALVLALIFLSVCGLTVGGLLSYSNTSSASTTALRTARGYDYDAPSSMDGAIATVRTNAGTGANCSGSGATVFTPLVATLNFGTTRPLHVDCYLQSSSSTQRNVVLLVCLNPAKCTDANPLLRANVIVYDTPTTGASISILTWSNR